MKALEQPDLSYVQAAQSHLQSGNSHAAERELGKVADQFRSHADVLEVEWAIEAQGGRWTRCLVIAQAIVKSAPKRPTGWIKRSFTLHRLRRPQEALTLLFPAAKLFPQIPIIPYNLACYAAELRFLWEAERWLKQAVETGGAQYQSMAAQESNLEPVLKRMGRT